MIELLAFFIFIAVLALTLSYTIWILADVVGVVIVQVGSFPRGRKWEARQINAGRRKNRFRRITALKAEVLPLLMPLYAATIPEAVAQTDAAVAAFTRKHIMHADADLSDESLALLLTVESEQLNESLIKALAVIVVEGTTYYMTENMYDIDTDRSHFTFLSHKLGRDSQTLSYTADYWFPGDN